MDRNPLRAHLEIRIADTPEMIALLRREMALIMREAAQHEPPQVQAFAARVAAAFEMGAKVQGVHSDGD